MIPRTYSDEHLIDGLQRMRRLKRAALRIDPRFALTDTGETEAAALRRALPHWHPDNLDAALAYPVDGGWNADILLRDAPEGHPLVLDQGEGQPFASRREAEAFLARFVTSVTAAWAPEIVLAHGGSAVLAA